MATSKAKSSSTRGYGDRFYAEKNEGSYASAKVILPLVFAVIKPRSVVDVGCGTGTWLKAAEELGAGDYHGYDGSRPSKLYIPEERFTAADLAQPLKPGRRFDLAICCEVAEHLPTDAAETLVATVTLLSDVVLFSAAIPGQGGRRHVNEQWPAYWQNLFGKRHYSAYDCIQPWIWNERQVEWWYRQNTILYVADAGTARFSLPSRTAEVLSLVHPELYEAQRRKKVLKNFVRKAKRAITRT
jgi:SAM-dependent methyltransferase